MNLQLPTILAFGFTNLAMLGWLAAAAAPLLIHLWSRRRFREVDWAAMTFLLAALRRNARRIQLQQWLLLAVRTLVILLVVFAVAEPYAEGLLGGGPVSAPTHKVLVVDGSFSMAYRGDDGSLFARAKQLAADLVGDGSPGDVFTVIAMTAPAQRIVGHEMVDRAAVVSQIQSLPQTHTTADLPGTLTLIEEALERAATERNRIDRQEVYFFTDLQHATWGDSTVAEDGSENDVRQRLAALAEQAAVVAVDLGVPRAENLVVTRLTTPEPLVTVERDVPFAATLRQYDDRPRSQCVVELLVDGQPVGEQMVDVPAGSELTVRFLHRFHAPGEYTIAARTEGDRLDVDNTRWLVVPVREEIRVLCVAGQRGAARHIADALDPDPSASSLIRPIVVTEGELAEIYLDQFDCVFLSNVAQLTASEADRLTRFAEQGGGVVIFLGDRVLPDQYNLLSPPLRVTLSPAPTVPLGSRHLLPARLGALVAEPQFGLDPLDYRHPIVAPFRGRERAGLLTTPVARYIKLELPPNRADVEPALLLANGDPLVVAAPLGRGRAVLVATAGGLDSIDPQTGEPWTAWPTWPSFLPIVREMLNYAAGGRHEQQERPVGTAIGGSGSPAQITRPDGRTDAVRVSGQPDGLDWHYDQTDLSGIYMVRGASGNQSEQRFAVNVDTTESDLAQIDAARLPPGVVVRDRQQESIDMATADLLPRAAWHRGFLWAALALLMLESWLAWLFGRGVT